jgi:hypothetical protein
MVLKRDQGSLTVTFAEKAVPSPRVENSIPLQAKIDKLELEAHRAVEPAKTDTGKYGWIPRTAAR